MSTLAGFTQMGSQPVGGRARAVDACVSERSHTSHPAAAATSAHGAWHAGTGLGLMAITAITVQAKPAYPTFTAVPDTNRHRRPRGTP